MSGLRQYGIGRCSFGGAIVVTTPGPPGTYNDSDVQDLVWALIDDNKFPEPDDRHESPPNALIAGIVGERRGLGKQG